MKRFIGSAQSTAGGRSKKTTLTKMKGFIGAVPQYLRTIADHRRCSKSSRGSAKEGPDWPVKDKQCKKVGCAQQQSRRFLFRFWSTVFHTHCSRKSILWKSRFPNRRGWRNKFVPHIWSGSDSEAAVAKGLPPTNPDVRENVLLYRYDLKVSKKEPLRRLLISKGHFFSRTPCSFCSSKVVWIGWQLIRRQHYITTMSNNVVIVDSDFQTVSTGPPFSMRQARIFPPPWMGDSAAPLTPGTLAQCSTPAFCGQHPLCLNIKVYLLLVQYFVIWCLVCLSRALQTEVQ